MRLQNAQIQKPLWACVCAHTPLNGILRLCSQSIQTLPKCICSISFLWSSRQGASYGIENGNAYQKCLPLCYSSVASISRKSVWIIKMRRRGCVQKREKQMEWRIKESAATAVRSQPMRNGMNAVVSPVRKILYHFISCSLSILCVRDGFKWSTFAWRYCRCSHRNHSMRIKLSLNQSTHRQKPAAP